MENIQSALGFLPLILVAITIALIIPLIIWANKDGRERGIPSPFLAITLVVTFPWGPLIWFLLRDRIKPSRGKRPFDLNEFRE